MRSRRTAFTLVELLVVISIIGMLMAILLPAVGAATESARSAQCKNRLKQMALAMMSYESRTQSMPGYVDGFERDGSGRVPEAVPHSWLVSILPDLERQDIYDNYSPGFEAPYLDFLNCPSDPPLQKSSYTSYVANAGYAEADVAGCGVMHTAWPLRAPNGKKAIHQRTSLDKISAGDGSTNTILLTENVQADKWDALSFFDKNASAVQIPAQKNDSPNGPYNVVVYHNKTNPGEAYLVNSKVDTKGIPWSPTAQATLVNARPSSEHRGIVNTAFADGRVQSLKENVEYSVYARLLSTDGKKCNKGLSGGIDHTVLLSDTDYQ